MSKILLTMTFFALQVRAVEPTPNAGPMQKYFDGISALIAQEQARADAQNPFHMKYQDVIVWTNTMTEFDIIELFQIIRDSRLTVDQIEVVLATAKVSRGLQDLNRSDLRDDFELLDFNSGWINTIFAFPELRNAFAECLRTLTAQQISKTSYRFFEEMLFGSDAEKLFTANFRAEPNLRKLFLRYAPDYFNGMTDSDIEEVLINSTKSGSRLGVYAAEYELARRTGSSQLIEYFRSGEFWKANLSFLSPGTKLRLLKAKLLSFSRKDMLHYEGLFKQIWELGGFQGAEYESFIKELSKSSMGVQVLMWSSARTNFNYFPLEWTFADKVIEEFLFSLGKGSIETDLYVPDAVAWLKRASQIAPEKVRAEALLVAIDYEKSMSERQGQYYYTHYRREHLDFFETLMQFPRLLDHPRGVQALEEAISDRNFYTTNRLDALILRSLDTIWKDNSQAPLWREAMSVNRNSILPWYNPRKKALKCSLLL